MEVILKSCTPDALGLLLSTKNTRLKNDELVEDWSDERKREELMYMLNTIKSSWEFVEYVFLIKGVTRAFTHQLVRTRTGSYAQQSQRTVNVSDQPVVIPESIANFDAARGWWDYARGAMTKAYASIVDLGIPVQDARGILPTNITTDIYMKWNLRTFHDTAKVRLCTRTQGEYQLVFRAMREKILGVHPWAEPFIQVACVSDGVCAFPLYGIKDCKFYDPRMDQSEVKKDTHKMFWAGAMEEAVPIAKKGKTM